MSTHLTPEQKIAVLNAYEHGHPEGEEDAFGLALGVCRSYRPEASLAEAAEEVSRLLD
jgi:hypothetical protein